MADFSISAECWRVGCLHKRRLSNFGRHRSALAPLTRSHHQRQQAFVYQQHDRRRCGLRPILAASVTERYEAAEARDPIRPLRHPLTAWQRWWNIGATPRAELPQSQKFSRICARLWGIMKHSKTSLTFAVMFMVSYAGNVLNSVRLWTNTQ